jgi:hypothetical protein
MTQAQMNRLLAAFSGIKTCSVEHFGRMKDVLKQAPTSMLTKLADSDVAFVNTAANSVLVDRGVRGWESKVDHIARVMTKEIRTRKTA